MTKFLHIDNIAEVTPPGLDGHQYQLKYDVGEMVSGVFQPIESRQTTITTSGTLQAVWGLSDTQVAESSATAAASIITTVASRDALDELQPIQLNTFTVAKAPPTGPKASPGALIPIPESPESKPTPPTFSILSDDIAEIRDQINALANALLGGRLLELPQERAILDIYKPAVTAEEFRNRVQSLAGICVAINKNIVGTHLGKSSTKGVGSIVLLEELLSSFNGSKEAAAVCGVLKNINELRKGYPTHVDNTDKFLSAHDFFKIEYPIENYEAAWDAILGGYFRSMEKLRDILGKERQKTVSK
ncbi:MAG: hypothetical protein RPT95_06995 [Candidatus Sedimenticola sp. (ex Thyasira tokunagai)]